MQNSNFLPDVNMHRTENSSALWHLEPSNDQCFIMAAILEFKMAATRFVRHFILIHCWTQHVKISLFSKFQCHRSFGTKDSNVQRFVMAAILEFKMAADPLVRPLGSDHFWTQHVKIPLYAKFHTFCRMWTSGPIFVTYLPHYKESLRKWTVALKRRETNQGGRESGWGKHLSEWV